MGGVQPGSEGHNDTDQFMPPLSSLPESFTASGFPRGRADETRRLLSSVASSDRSGCLRDSGVVAPSASSPLAVAPTLPIGFCDTSEPTRSRIPSW